MFKSMQHLLERRAVVAAGKQPCERWRFLLAVAADMSMAAKAGAGGAAVCRIGVEQAQIVATARAQAVVPVCGFVA